MLDHELYRERYSDAATWLRAAKDKYARSAGLAATKDDLHTKQAIVQVGSNIQEWLSPIEYIK